MKKHTVSCEIQKSDYRIQAEAFHHTVRDGQVVVRIDGHGYYEGIALDDLTDDSRRLILNSKKEPQ